MADGDNTEPREERQEGQDVPPTEPTDPAADFHMELVDSLPGGRAVMGVEQEGHFTWLADRHHVSRQARDELVEQLTRIVREGWWTQNWHGR